jgi:hypothetical protein
MPRRYETRKNRADTVGRRAHAQVKGKAPRILPRTSRPVGTRDRKRNQTKKDANLSIVIMFTPSRTWL